MLKGSAVVYHSSKHIYFVYRIAAIFFADNTSICIFMNGGMWIAIKNSLEVVPKSLINNIPASVQILAWHQPGDKPLSYPIPVSVK